jgi:hypothetical protein
MRDARSSIRKLAPLVGDHSDCQSGACAATAGVEGVAHCNFVRSPLDSQYKAIRAVTRSLTAGLSAEDQMVQWCPGASPVKCLRSHSTARHLLSPRNSDEQSRDGVPDCFAWEVRLLLPCYRGRN